MTKRNQWIGFIIVLLAFLVAGIYLFSRHKESGSSAFSYPATKVAVATVEYAVAPRIFRGVGQLEADQQVLVSSETNGQITKIAFQSGQTVNRGDLLVQLNDDPEVAEKARLEAKLHNAEIQYKRFKRLVRENASSREKLDNAEAELNMVKGDLQEIAARIAQKSIRAPFSGEMGIRQINLGQYLNSGDPIASLVNSSILRANFALDEKISSELSIGQKVKVEVDSYPDQQFDATITSIDPLIGQSRLLQLQATLDRASISQRSTTLRAGMFIKVNVQQQNVVPVLTIPETAVTYSAYGNSVFKVNEDESGISVTRVSVNIGERWNGTIEVIDGVKEHDRVVTSGQIKLQDGSMVEILPIDTLHAKGS